MNLLHQRRTWLLIILISSLLQALSAFLSTPSARILHRQRHMPMIADEKIDDGFLYWEAGYSGVQLPEFKTRPKMIVFDKDGTLGDDAASLKRWTNHMTRCMEHALIELQLSREIIAQAIKALHDKLGWDASVGHVIPSAPLAAGTWQEAVELSSNVFQHYGLSSSVASEWHKELRNVHGADPPVISNLCDMLQSCRDLGLIVAVCTSDDRSPTNNALRNWSITHLVDLSLCGDEVSEPKPSALPLEMLCRQANLIPEEVIIVGDTTGDTGMARNAQAGLCVGVLSGSGAAHQLMETGANIILPHVGHIPSLLNCMGLEKRPAREEEQLVPDLQKASGNVTVGVMS